MKPLYREHFTKPLGALDIQRELCVAPRDFIHKNIHTFQLFSKRYRACIMRPLYGALSGFVHNEGTLQSPPTEGASQNLHTQGLCTNRHTHVSVFFLQI